MPGSYRRLERHLSEPPFREIRTLLSDRSSGSLLASTLAHGNAIDALLYVALFCPELDEVDGHILLVSEQFDSRDELRTRFKTALAQLGQSPVGSAIEALEREFNVLEPGEAFVSWPPMSAGERDAVEHALAESVKLAWRGRLAAAYPGRRLHVQILVEDEENPLSVVFWEERPGVSGYGG
ncbi:MAG: hypothetical protein M3P85_00610 [Actinomycetota bacterium]|nr:hypothetical protein [Actinomycetota bacterium]